MITIEQIRERLIKEIRNSGMTQTELAKKIGVIQQSVGQYLSGRAMPTLDRLANICKVLDIDANYILCLTD